MNINTTVTLTVELVRDNPDEKSILISNGDKKEWIPRSQITYMGKLEDNMVQIVIPAWLAKRKGIR